MGSDFSGSLTAGFLTACSARAFRMRGSHNPVAAIARMALARASRVCLCNDGSAGCGSDCDRSARLVVGLLKDTKIGRVKNGFGLIQSHDTLSGPFYLGASCARLCSAGLLSRAMRRLASD